MTPVNTSLLNPHDESVIPPIHELIRSCGGDPTTFEGDLITQIIQTGLKLIDDGHDAGQLKLITRALKEMRYAYRIFNNYRTKRIISIFGSARTPETHPDYQAALSFSRQMAELGWMTITGAAEGIMKAGHEGGKAETSFGLSILLPFEARSNAIIEGDPKLISFRYFFTRKLMFVSHAYALAAFPGGFGTQDEIFEVLTLIQTGKGNIIPIVLIEGEGGHYWRDWEKWVREDLLKPGWISAHDQNLYYITSSTEDAVHHIQGFYKVYHSSRYVKDNLVIRLRQPLTEEQLELINENFASLLIDGKIIACKAFPEETDHLELPRIAFHHTRKNYGLLRALINQLNEF
jgi:uncharacterized protein (TIGR00730 family)